MVIKRQNKYQCLINQILIYGKKEFVLFVSGRPETGKITKEDEIIDLVCHVIGEYVVGERYGAGDEIGFTGGTQIFGRGDRFA